MGLQTIATLKEGKCTLICTLKKVHLEEQGNYAVLRVEDGHQTLLRFRKFDLNKIRQELYSTRVEMWKISSPKVDILVSWPPGEVLPDLKKWMVVCLQNLECRTVPTEGLEMDLSIHELYLNIGNGGRLEILDSKDPDTCRRERLDRELVSEETPYIGTIDISEIREGVSFTLVCEVVKCGREDDTNHEVLRVKDSSRSNFKSRKFDFDHSGREDNFHNCGSHEVDVWFTSPMDLSNMMSKIVTMGPINASRITLDAPGGWHLYLQAETSSGSFEIDVLNEERRRVQTLRKKILRVATM